MKISPILKKSLEKQQYKIIGDHGAVKICLWAKKSLVDEDFCYKEKFYGVKSHLCCQMTPSLICSNSCVYCWRFISESTVGTRLKGKIDEPKEIIQNCIKAQKELLSGFGGDKKVNKKKLNEAQDPRFWAISLLGEPTIYPQLSDLIEELHKRKNCSFLVTNGQFPEKIESLNKLPTQLYVSLDAPNKKIYTKIDKPLLKNAWEKLNKTLELLPSLNTRTVIRLTLVKDLNMRDEKQYASLIKKANPLFIECKGYMWVGSSRERLEMENMPLHSDVKKFAEKIASFFEYKIIDEKKESGVVLLSKEDRKDRIIQF